MEKINLRDEVYLDNKKNSKKGYEIGKRIFDLISSLIVLILTSPIFVIISILIKLDSKGPIFFGHNRIGRNGKVIKVYKFRTMHENSAEIFEQFTPEQKKGILYKL